MAEMVDRRRHDSVLGVFNMAPVRIGEIMDWSKLTSGKFLFTVITAGVFAFCALTDRLPPDKIYDIISIVVVAYFMKQSNGGAK